MRRQDLFSGLFLILVGGFFLRESVFVLPWKNTGYEWYGAPGFTPAILAAILIFGGAMLVWRSLKNDAFYDRWRALERTEQEAMRDSLGDEGGCEVNATGFLASEWKRATLTVALCAVYVFLLLGNVPYIVATAVFLATFILLFRGAGVLKTFLIAGIGSVSVWFVFYKIFAVFLP